MSHTARYVRPALLAALRAIAFPAIVLALLAACRAPLAGEAAADALRIHRDSYTALGTWIDVQIVAREPQRPADLLAGVRAILAHVEHLYSTHDPSSFVSRLNAQAGGEPLRVAPEEREVFDELAATRRMSELSGGAFDITFESVGRFWRFDPENPRLPTADEMRGAVAKIDYRRVEADREAGTVRLVGKETRIGLGGIAKGAALDQAVVYLKAHGVSAALLNIGGDFYGYGRKPNGQPWVLGLEHPRHKGQMLDEIRIPVQDQAVFTSGDYERSFAIDGRLYHHIIDPRTAMPATGAVSVTTITKPPQYGLSLSLFVLGPELGFRVLDRLHGQGVEAEAIVITDCGDIVTSDGLPQAWRQIRVDLGGEPAAKPGPIGSRAPSAPPRAAEVLDAP